MSFAIAIAVFVLGLTTMLALYFGLSEPRSSWQKQRGVSRYGATSSLARSSLQWSGTAGRLLAWWVDKKPTPMRKRPRCGKPASH
jgi:hypothetical protein